MDAPATDMKNLMDIGAPFAGGFYAGRIRIDGQLYALIVAPKAEGERENMQYIHDGDIDVAGAISYNDGLVNTNHMAAAGSEMAKWARSLRIGEFDDWYIPSQDELEVLYRNLKPTTRKNWCYARSGINLNAEMPTTPYTPDFPVQTTAVALQEGQEQAFADEWYWSSTRHIAESSCAWCQYFTYGFQGYGSINDELRARAVRRLPI